MNGTEKFDIMLRDVQANEKFNYNLFSVTEMLLYKLKGDKHLIPMWNQTRSIVFDLMIRKKNEALFCAKFRQTQSFKQSRVVQKIQRKYSR